jgi:hypothetical protein
MFFDRPSKSMRDRLDSLRGHLMRENPILVDAIDRFRELDKVAYRLGLLTPQESYATGISWWPLISILGTFSAGKSTFINDYTTVKLQQTGNQAVDDKFTVVCFSQEDEVRVLPGLSLDADPRFPFYQISEEIEKVAAGEGSRIDSYLQLKTCPSDQLMGKILIDSPGFDADAQRNSTLRITDHIIDLSDLVLVFFDARHPEPGAMQDTLAHLVSGTIRRNDAGKFLFILNQIDTTAGEDNLEEVVAAWQRAIVQHGLATGRFYCLYNESAGVNIDDPAVEKRITARRDKDLEEIKSRMSEVSVERVYRIIGALENMANQIEQQAVPKINQARDQWMKRVLLFDGIILAVIIAILAWGGFEAGYWGQGGVSTPEWMLNLGDRPVLLVVIVLAVLGVWGVIHFFIRNKVAKRIARHLARIEGPGSISAAFLKNTRWRHSIFRPIAVGWTRGSRNLIEKVRTASDRYVQALNDRFTDPSGTLAGQNTAEEVVESRADQNTL